MHRSTQGTPLGLALILCAALFIVHQLLAQQSPHGPLSMPCTDCHTTSSWKELASPMQFDHSTTMFVLRGRHITVGCMKCHTTGKFSGTPAACYDCHKSEYANITMPNHNLGKFPHDCTQCHTENGWPQSTFQHSKTNFQLTGAHQTVDCALCHTNNRFAGLPADCFTCHQQAYNQTTAPDHKASQFSHDCLNCHNTSGWKPSSFDHAKTNFPLAGAHRRARCSDCHTNGKFAGLPTDCFGCHQTNFAKVTAPGHVTGNFDHNCTLCHTVDVWKPSTFNHANTAFALTGAHQRADCASCHKNGVFKGLASDCYSCHRQDFARPVNPNHVTAQLSHECIQCHTLVAWKPSSFDHQKTQFPLTGAHRTSDCSSCHKNGKFTGLQTDCFACHQSDFSKVITPNHVSGSFDHNCTSCHTTSVWKPSTFNHANTSFPLTGAHQATDCASCHKNGVFKGTASDCYSCHRQDFTQAISPNHVTAQLSHDCTQCHSMSVWKPSSFDHQKTAFPLAGAHQSALCSSCHKNGVFKGLATDCFTCHQTDFTAVTDPNHVAGMFDHNCTACHSTTSWKPATFDHKQTSFPLTGAHQTALCASCHKNGVFKGLASGCFSCHQQDFAQPVAPNHITAQFPHDCSPCHTTIVWKPSTFNHAATAFPLTGAHQATDCASCHKNGIYKGTSTDCFSCHQTDFAKPVTPNHVTSQLSHDCTQCHSMTAWKPSTFDHQKTIFPLTGAHLTALCASCHKNGQYTGLPTDCFSCHQTDFTKVTDPNHVTGMFDHNCTACHSATAWKPATFDHNKTTFPLTGAHQTALCASCHKNGVFKGLASDCFSCHQQDFARPTAPNHVTAQFSHDCTPCHSTSVWKPSTFNHAATAFPLTGAHQTTDCLFCHKNGQYKGTPVDCWTCHQTDFSKVADPNHVTGGFDHICTLCHTTSAWKPATFDHQKTNFPLTGAHAQTVCAKCHVGGKYAGTSTDCYTCHVSDFNTAKNPDHAAGQYPRDCTTCHSTAVWQPWTFNHDALFRINSHHRNRAACSDCHKIAGNLKAFNCLTGCHTRAHRQNEACYPCHTN